MVAATDDASLVATTPSAGGNDTILRFAGGGGFTTSTLDAAQVTHLVKDDWASTALTGGDAGMLKGENIDWATSGWFSPDQGKTNAGNGKYELMGTAKTDPQQASIRSTYALAKLKLEQDTLLPNSTCSTWFDSGVGSSVAFITALLDNDSFAHAEFKKGGSLAGGDQTAAFTGHFNADGTVVPGRDTTAGIHFNRRGSFFQNKGKDGPYNGGTLRAQLLTALHELAHLMQDPGLATSVVEVPGFVRDGADTRLSEKNTQLVLNKCQVMIERP